MTDGRMRTIDARPVLAGATVFAVLLMALCLALGYRLAQSSEATTVTHLARAASLDLRRPEGRVLLDRVGDLAGRITRLEAEAAALTKRLGVTSARPVKASNSRAEVQASASEGTPVPRGGPLLPVSFAGNATSSGVGDYGTGLTHLDAEIALLEASLDHLNSIVAERELQGMSYPNRVPLWGQMPRISSAFGVRRDPFTGRLARHMGLDIPAAQGTAVLASGGGRVQSAGYRGPYGNAIVIDHGHGLQTLYGHCSKLFVRPGDLVLPQQKIAAVGSTGRSTGPHLHFEVIRNGVRVEPGRVLDSVLARNAN
jgi:murein DD-endopeptidase MepM/ murein hydrolase activator NlpD